ncbi:MAG: HAD family hydrolase [Acutalibacteraceae bacterium]
MQKKTIFFDIDGTLLDCWHNKPFTIPESNRQALQLLKQQGHQIIACTGRHEAFLKKYFPGIFDSYITMNGSILFTKEILFTIEFSLEEVSYLMKHFDEVSTVCVH